MAYDSTKLKGLFKRVYNNQMIENDGVSDVEDIKALCSKVFGDGGATPDPSLLHQFNTILVQTADEIARPKATNLLGLFAEFKSEKAGNIHSYTIPAKSKAKFKWSALGTGVDLVRVESGKKTVAVPTTIQTGCYYEPLDMVQDSVENFKKLVDDVADAKIRLDFATVSKLIQSAISSGKIPTANHKSGSNLTLADYNKIASVIQRVGFGGRPIFVADTLLIDHFANLQVSDSNVSKILTESAKEELLTALNISTIGRTTAMNLVNPFIDEANSKVELPVNEGYFFSGTATNKPIVIIEYGGLRQFTEQDPEDERVKLMLKQEVAIELVIGQNVGYVKDDSITL